VAINKSPSKNNAFVRAMDQPRASELHANRPLNPNELTQSSPKGKAILATAPSLNNAAVIESFQGNVMGKDVDLGMMVEMLEMSVKTVGKGDLSGLEAMLVGQATALQTIFTSLARKAAVQQHLPLIQTYMGLALKAQAQSRAAITALVDLKHPKQAAFFGQTNLTTGPQQVNNVIHASAQSMPTKNPPNQLSEGSNELHQNSGAQSVKGSFNSTLEAMGGVNRA